MTALPTAVHELLVAPLAFALAFAHARTALGSRRAAGELLALAAYGFALEAIAMAVFRSHQYDASWHVAPLGVPVAVALVWAAVIASALAVAARRAPPRATARAALAAVVAVTLDLAIEPVAVRARLWAWTPPGPWLGVPVGNFVGWLVIVGAYTAGAERWAGDGGIAHEAPRRIALAAGAVASLVAVGLAWRRLHLEEVFTGRGWLVWAALVVATAAASRRLAPPGDGHTLAARLARAPGPLPGATLLLVATAFAADAALLGDWRVGLAVLGPAAALIVATRTTSHE